MLLLLSLCGILYIQCCTFCIVLFVSIVQVCKMLNMPRHCDARKYKIFIYCIKQCLLKHKGSAFEWRSTFRLDYYTSLGCFCLYCRIRLSFGDFDVGLAWKCGSAFSWAALELWNRYSMYSLVITRITDKRVATPRFRTSLNKVELKVLNWFWPFALKTGQDLVVYLLPKHSSTLCL